MTRKVIYCLFLILLPGVPCLVAQKYPQFRYIGLDAGLTLSGIRSSDNYAGNLSNFGARTGLSGNYSFCVQNSVEAAIFFEQKGGNDPVHDITTNLNYLTLPVYYKLSSGKDPQLFVTAGAYISHLISASRKGMMFADGETVRVNENVTGRFRPFDAGLTAGAGMMVRLYDDFDFKVSVGIAGGLLRVFEDFTGNNPANLNIHISAGYIYYIGFR
jgi:hypothetical protein